MGRCGIDPAATFRFITERNLSATMSLMRQAEEMLRRFNEDEAVWRCYEHKRRLRKLLGSRSPLPEETLDHLDWQAAERECRQTPRPETVLGFPVGQS